MNIGEQQHLNPVHGAQRHGTGLAGLASAGSQDCSYPYAESQSEGMHSCASTSERSCVSIAYSAAREKIPGATGCRKRRQHTDKLRAHPPILCNS